MKVALLHNEQAGSSVPVEEIVGAIERFGHTIATVVAHSGRIHELLARPVDLAVAAGGDGTVAAAAEAVKRRGVPLAILPCGTANNIASSILPARSMTELIRGWNDARRVPFDRGVARGQWGDLPFWEGVGGGLFLEGMARMKGDSDAEAQPADARIGQALQTYGETLRNLPGQRCTVTLDDFEVRGELLLLEVLNTRSVGPNLTFGSQVNPWDGLLSVVVGTTEHREALAVYFSARVKGGSPVLNLPVHHTRRAVVEGLDFVHIDGDVRAAAESVVTLSIDSGAVEMLV